VKLPRQAKSVVKVPVPFAMTEDVGLGDAIKRLTSTVGISPCEGCARRAAYLDQRVVFTSRRDGQDRGRSR
jgi:hypothetical protein